MRNLIHSRGVLSALAIALVLQLSSTFSSVAQDGAQAPSVVPSAAAAETPVLDTPAITDEPAETEEPAETSDDPAEDSSTDREPPSEAPSQDALAGDTPADDADAANTEAADANSTDAPADASGSFDWTIALLIIAVLIVPTFAGNWIAQRIKMPDYGWKLGLVLTTLAIAGLCLTTGSFKFGTDLAGGTTLIYEVEDKSRIAEEEEGKVKLDQVIGALKMRIDPAGTKEVSIRKYGEDIEVIVPQQSSEAELDYIKRKLTDLGELEFRITASPVWTQDTAIIAEANKLSPGQKEVSLGGQVRARWVSVDPDEFSLNEPGFVTRQVRDKVEALVLVDAMNVTGEFLSSAASIFDNQTARPAVSFNFNAAGSARFGKLTGDNLPNSATGRKRNLGILLDNTLISAPYINSRITSQGQISGQSMTQEEVDHVVSVLEAGSLPAALNKDPISEETISPTLGPITIKMATYAITVSLIAVLAFILFYYRFAGVVACLALVANLVLVLGLMIVLGAAFTLPGLAGLVLTVGMSVDANVLIFERIREELSRGGALRMAIRNGFDRATTTIIDANVTTLITGIVLYSIGTDQIKGFAVTLILGILMSMYTAIFCSRLIFEIAERRRWIKSLKFWSLVGKTEINFTNKYGLATAFSLVVIAAGLVGVFGRQAGLLNIDFTGGVSVTQVMAPGEEMKVEDVRAALLKTDLADKNLLVSERGESGDRFSINTSYEDVEGVKQILSETFGQFLLKNAVEIGEVTPFTDGDLTGSQVELTFNEGDAYGEQDGMTHDALTEQIKAILADRGNKGLEPILENELYKEGTSQRFKQWTLKLGLPADATQEVATTLKDQLTSQPIFPLANKIGGKVAGNLQGTAIKAIVVSLLGIVGYLWFRFQNVAFGLAAVVALMHDVLVTLGFVAVSAYIVDAAPSLATALQLNPFQISLTMIAAFLTIIGYSLNDTIVIFDRIREVRGKSPKLTPEMVNTSINQTLSRTLLTSITTLIVVAILYFFGGPGIHDFAFALVVGVIAGTYSTIFIACPALLAMVGSKPEPASQTTGDNKADAA